MCVCVRACVCVCVCVRERERERERRLAGGVVADEAARVLEGAVGAPVDVGVHQQVLREKSQ